RVSDREQTRQDSRCHDRIMSPKAPHRATSPTSQFEAPGKLDKSRDHNVSLCGWDRVRRAGRPPFGRAVDEGGLVPFAAGRVEIEIMAGDHQDLAGRHPEELCGTLVSL